MVQGVDFVFGADRLFAVVKVSGRLDVLVRQPEANALATAAFYRFKNDVDALVSVDNLAFELALIR